MKPIVCIVNPRACGGRADINWPIASRKLVRQGIEFDTLTTTAPGDGTRLARQALAEGATTIVAVGGDGTVHEVVNGFFEGDRPLNPDARLGILPMGTGSDLIKTFGIPAKDDGAIAVLQRNQPHTVDLARITYQDREGRPRSSYYINTASAGLTGAVLAKMRGLPSFLSGSPAYMIATVQTLIGYKAFPLELTIDGIARASERAMMVVIGNGRYFGGGMKVLPQASADDGLLDVLILKEQSVPELLMNFPRLYAGTHMSLPFVESVRARKVTIAGPEPLLLEVDGEQPGVTPSTFEIVPQALKVLM